MRCRTRVFAWKKSEAVLTRPSISILLFSPHLSNRLHSFGLPALAPGSLVVDDL